jgi:hypothetical protein
MSWLVARAKVLPIASPVTARTTVAIDEIALSLLFIFGSCAFTCVTMARLRRAGAAKVFCLASALQY